MSSNSSVFKDLLNHFQSESKKLSNIISETSIHENKPDLGSIREDLFVDFLKRYVPSRFNIEKGGFIFDSKGNKSNQLDIIITTDFTLKFLHTVNSKSFNCIEGCVAVVSMKTDLTKSELKDSILNLNSIPIIKKYQKHPTFKNFEDMVKPLPLKIIFALKGAGYKTTWLNLHEIISQNNISVDQSPDIIIVNDQLVILKAKSGFVTLSQHGINTPLGKYIGFSKEHTDFVGSRALISLLTEIQQIGNITKEANLDFAIYMDKIKRSDDTWKLIVPPEKD